MTMYRCVEASELRLKEVTASECVQAGRYARQNYKYGIHHSTGSIFVDEAFVNYIRKALKGSDFGYVHESEYAT